jgi:hypothetical protein
MGQNGLRGEYTHCELPIDIMAHKAIEGSVFRLVESAYNLMRTSR